MKCIHCNQDSKKKQVYAQGGRCVFCGHLFVCEPSRDGLSDMLVKTIEAGVSANGRYFFLKSHLAYQLRRYLKKKLWASSATCFLWFLFFAASLFFIKTVVLFMITLLAGIALLIAAVTKTKYKNALDRLDVTVSNWVNVNSHEKMLTAEKYPASLNIGANNSEFADIYFDRVLICDRNDIVDFFLANLFHFHHVCPVLSGNEYPQSLCKDMLQRLKKNPSLQVFLLHDYTSEGVAFVSRIKTDPNWFGGKHGITIIELGLMRSQKKLFSGLTQRLTGRDKRTKEIAELTLFKPATLLTMCAMAINEAVPLHLISDITVAEDV